MKIENTEVWGFNAAIRAMRNPLDSWHLSDSDVHNFSRYNTTHRNFNAEGFVLGEKDQILSQRLTKGGSEHRKHLRTIQVWTDLTLPRYIWSEFDTYKYVNKNSCSTMHTLMKHEIDESNFEQLNVPMILIDKINSYIKWYNESDDQEEKDNYLYACKNILPEGFLQKRTINTNYECLLSMYLQRKNHRLPEWHTICNWIIGLPYLQELTGVEI